MNSDKIVVTIEQRNQKEIKDTGLKICGYKILLGTDILNRPAQGPGVERFYRFLKANLPFIQGYTK